MDREDKKTRLSASVVLYRENPELEIFMVLRSRTLGFFGGYHAFPGGAHDDGDAREGASELSTLAHTAARELLEETGILRVEKGSQAIDPDVLDEFRHRLIGLDSKVRFQDTLDELGLAIAEQCFRPICRMTTPAFSKVRFDTQFFLVASEPDDPDASVIPGELDSGRWWKPEEVLTAWRNGDLYVAPPVLGLLHALATEPLGNALETIAEIPRHYEGSGRAIPWTPGLEMLPLTSAPLPPSVPTNVFLVGEEKFLIFDPAPSGSAEQAHLFAAIDRRIRLGHRPEAIVLTHHHRDHIGALEATLQRYNLPVWSHPLTARDYQLPLDRTLGDGDWIDLGTAPDGHSPWGLRALFTPGHAIGHLVFEDPHYGVLIAGDLVSTIMSIFVGTPGGGHLRTYIDSVRKMLKVSAKILFPSHGPPTFDVHNLFEHTLEHRDWRIEKVRGALDDTFESLEKITDLVYRDVVDRRLRDLCLRTTRAALEYLEEDRVVESSREDRYRLRT